MILLGPAKDWSALSLQPCCSSSQSTSWSGCFSVFINTVDFSGTCPVSPWMHINLPDSLYLQWVLELKCTLTWGTSSIYFYLESATTNFSWGLLSLESQSLWVTLSTSVSSVSICTHQPCAFKANHSLIVNSSDIIKVQQMMSSRHAPNAALSTDRCSGNGNRKEVVWNKAP